MQNAIQPPEWAETLFPTTRAEVDGLIAKANSALGRVRAVEARAESEGRDLTELEAAQVQDQLDAVAGFRSDIEAHKPMGRITAPNRPSASYGTRRDRAGFSDLGEFARAVHTSHVGGGTDPRLIANAAGMQVGVGADGGFYVPPDFRTGLVDASLQAEAIRPRATLIPMASGVTTLPLFDTTARNSGIAGLEPEHAGEGDTGTDQKAKTRLVSLTARKLMVLVPTTAELIEDGGEAFTMLLQKYIVESLSAKLDDLFINGSGAGQPLGIVKSAAAVTVAKESNQVAATIVPENLAKMSARLAPGSWSNAVWLASPSVVSQLFLLVQKVQNAAANDFVGGFGPGWLTADPTNGITLMGRPVVVSDRCQQVGTVGDIILADLSQYIVGIRSEARLQVDNSVGFKSDEIYFRLTMRVDGMPLLVAPITPRKGTDTLSPFVLLATRG